ncbi:MAG: methyltransferase domain-containing protein [Oscillospiraceae bacterium]|nr:methyltransferase domain-containing protein [Oscillospiraceae bacterium]
MENKDLKNINTNEINRESWDAYQETYAKLMNVDSPEGHEFYSKGGVGLDDYAPIMSLIGDVKGLKLLVTCCGCDASQTFSWHNLGAKVTACDIAPKAIEIAKRSAEIRNLDVEFVIADMQTLEPIADDQFDIIYAQYPVWIQDFFEACRTWSRVLKKGGRLFLAAEHPILACITEDSTGVHIIKNYNDTSPDWIDTFTGTGMAESIGWSVDLPSVENFWRVSDILNAIFDAGFYITKVHEGYDISEGDEHLMFKGIENEPQMRKLPSDFLVLAVKQ